MGGLGFSALCPTPSTSTKTFSEYEKIRFNITNQPHPLPSLLQVCGDLRDATMKIYCVWLKQNGGGIYISKEHGIFYFGDDKLGNFLFSFALLKHHFGEFTEADEITMNHLTQEMKAFVTLNHPLN
jgi:hypothetical protein